MRVVREAFKHDPVGLLVCGLLGFVLFVGGMIVGILTTDTGPPYDPFSQADFPCAEDEVLGYARGLEDRVICLHIDDPWLGRVVGGLDL